MRMEFLQYIKTLEDLISEISVKRRPRDKEKFEFLVCNGFYNRDREYIGKFYALPNDLTIWVGYYKKLGFCISFFMEDEAKLENALYKSGYKHFDKEFCPKDNGNWFSIKIKSRRCLIKKFKRKLSQHAEEIIMAISQSI